MGKNLLFKVAYGFFIGCLCFNNPALAEDEKKNGTGLSFDANLILGALPVSRLGGEEVVIYEEAGNNTGSSGENNNRYFYPPVLLPEWEKFFLGANKQCSSDDGIAKITENLEVYISDNYYVDDLKSKIALEAGMKKENVRLLAIPFHNFEIYLNKNSGLETRTLYTFSEDAVPGVYALEYSYASRIRAKIDATCQELPILEESVYDGENVLEGVVFSSGVRYNKAAFYAHASTVFGAGSRSKIFGKESLVRVKNFDNTASNKSSILNLAMSFALNEKARPNISKTSGSARSSRQRILTRDYIKSLAQDSLFSLDGVCVGDDEAFCNSQEKRLLEWILTRFETINLDISKQQNGSAKLVSDQITYATLSPQQYKTLAKSVPEFRYENKETNNDNETTSRDNEKEGSKNTTSNEDQTSTENTTVKNDVTWDFSGIEPIPTNVDMVIVDEAKMNVEIGVNWRRQRPIKGSSGTYLIRMVYPSYNYADNQVCGIKSFNDRERVRTLCEKGYVIEDIPNRSRRKPDSSSKCRTTFDFTWDAPSGYYFKVQSKPVTSSQWGSASKRSFKHDPTTHERDVKKNGAAQMWSTYRVHGHSGHSSRPNDRECGTTATFEAKMYPLYCAYFQVDGYETKYGSPSCDYFSEILQD